MTDLGTLGGSTAMAWGINDHGEVVGYSNTAGGQEHAFLYSGGTMVDLNSLLVPGSGWTLKRAYAINNAGQIAGWGADPFGGTQVAFLLTPTPEPASTGLFALGLSLTLPRRREPRSSEP